MENYIPIPQFYADRSVFVTGGTGFLGKALVEKLLRSCPDIKNIYLLIRQKRNQDIKTRLNDLLASEIFDSVRRENPEHLEKVIPISGDMTSDSLGLSESDQNILHENVSIVFHSAATIRFDEKLDVAVKINVLGTKKMIELSRKMIKLAALVYVSTAYSNCDMFDISEIIYPTLLDPNNIIALTNAMPENLVELVTPILLDKKPNTYSFTKALAENLLNAADDLPVMIVRPSIVISTLIEPIPGWLGSTSGTTRLVAEQGTGILRVIRTDKSKKVDVIPVDLVVNTLIVSAWRVGTSADKKLQVYNCVTGLEHGITYEYYFSECRNAMRKYYPNWEPYYSIMCKIFNDIPIYILDFMTWLKTGKNPRYIRLLKNYYQEAIEKNQRFFTAQEWNFENTKFQQLQNELNPNDRSLFNMDITKICWKTFLTDYVSGIEKILIRRRQRALASTGIKR
ncbi:hypothetical protein DMENIID0001_070270 [Sergentomyia squamirostris]